MLVSDQFLEPTLAVLPIIDSGVDSSLIDIKLEPQYFPEAHQENEHEGGAANNKHERLTYAARGEQNVSLNFDHPQEYYKKGEDKDVLLDQQQLVMGEAGYPGVLLDTVLIHAHL